MNHYTVVLHNLRMYMKEDNSRLRNKMGDNILCRVELSFVI